MRKLYCFCIVSAFLSAAQSGHSLPPDCSLQETVVQAANHATEAEKLVLALPDAWRALYDPQREAFLSKTTTAAMKARLKELIDAYMPKAASEEDIRATVAGAIEKITADNGGTRPGPKDMGAVMKVAQARALADGARIDGKVLSELVKAELAKG